MSLKEELERRGGPNGYETLQEQINKLGEEIALDINEIEKRMNTLQVIITKP